jgi:hypothetical protein
MAAVAAAGTVAAPPRVRAQAGSASVVDSRIEKAHAYRVQRAEYYKSLPKAEHITNGDEQRYSNRINSFSKTLLHDQFGHVSRDAYNSLVRAIETGRKADFEAIFRGGNVRLKNPTGAYNYQLAGADQSQIVIPPAPAFSSAEQAAAITELYWQSLARDVPFAEYEGNVTITRACQELTGLTAYGGPRVSGRVTPGSVFRGHTPGDLAGPYVSQFLLAPFKMGHLMVEQKQLSAVPSVDFMTSYADYLGIQLGEGKGPGNRYETVRRYVRNGRDLATVVHFDWHFSPYYHALWTLLGYGANCYTENNPYTEARGQEPYINFGAPDSFDFVSRAGKPAFNAAWYQKWIIHRQARPEVFACRIHNHLSQVQLYPLHDSVSSSALEAVLSRQGNALLSQAYSEGSPAHSAYPSGHATVAGACVTMLKAFFRESFVMPNPVVASADGLDLVPFRGADLTVGNELNKLAFNIAMGRNWAGIHWRYDAWEGLKLGEQVAANILSDIAAGYVDDWPGFAFTAFDGAKVTICAGCTRTG